MSNILLLDDDPLILSLINSMLRPLGHTVLEATSAEEALRRFEQCDGSIDLLIADVTLPVSSGPIVALELRSLLPWLRVILMSGLTPDLWDEPDAAAFHELPSDSVSVLLKPFSTTSMVEGALRFAPPPGQSAPAFAALAGRPGTG